MGSLLCCSKNDDELQFQSLNYVRTNKFFLKVQQKINGCLVTAAEEQTEQNSSYVVDIAQ